MQRSLGIERPIWDVGDLVVLNALTHELDSVEIACTPWGSFERDEHGTISSWLDFRHFSKGFKEFGRNARSGRDAASGKLCVSHACNLDQLGGLTQCLGEDDSMGCYDLPLQSMRSLSEHTG